jgi:hypothetical protein
VNEHWAQIASQVPSIVKGRVIHVAQDGHLVVLVEGGAELRSAVLASGLSGSCRYGEGDVVLVWRSNGEAGESVVLGRIGLTLSPPTAETLVIEARQNLTLRCGEGSITIREDGKILIKGKDLVSHAQRMNRIKGGAVAIN